METILKELAQIANDLDTLYAFAEADAVAGIMTRIAQMNANQESSAGMTPQQWNQHENSEYNALYPNPQWGTSQFNQQARHEDQALIQQYLEYDNGWKSVALQHAKDNGQSPQFIQALSNAFDQRAPGGQYLSQGAQQETPAEQAWNSYRAPQTYAPQPAPSYRPPIAPRSGPQQWTGGLPSFGEMYKKFIGNGQQGNGAIPDIGHIQNWFNPSKFKPSPTWNPGIRPQAPDTNGM